jgi:hypothetical protein
MAIATMVMVTQSAQPLLVTEEHLGNLATIAIIIIVPFCRSYEADSIQAVKAKEEKAYAVCSSK